MTFRMFRISFSALIAATAIVVTVAILCCSEPCSGPGLEPLDKLWLLSPRNMHPIGLLEGGQRQTLPTAPGNLQMAQLTRP